MNPTGAPHLIVAGGTTSTFIVKYHPNGQVIWSDVIEGQNNYGFNIALTPNQEELVISGSFFNTVDFDPSVGTYELTSAGAADMYIAKYDTSGAYLWADQFACGTQGYRSMTDIEIDANGLIYGYGRFDGNVDFDPDIVAKNYIASVSFGIADICVLRLTGNGALDYVNTYGSSSSQLPSEMLLDPAGYYYLCDKLSASAVDFDPGPGIASFARTTVDGFIMKYALDGSFQQGAHWT